LGMFSGGKLTLWSNKRMRSLMLCCCSCSIVVTFCFGARVTCVQNGFEWEDARKSLLWALLFLRQQSRSIGKRRTRWGWHIVGGSQPTKLRVAFDN
jgi:hypothetical protein